LTDGRHYYNKYEKKLKSYGSYDKEAIRFITDYRRDEIFFVSDDKAGWDITNIRLSHLKNNIENSHKIMFDNISAEGRYELVENAINRKDIFKHIENVVFIGDSLSDIKAMSLATWVGTTANAPRHVHYYVDYVSKYEGGKGGFADIIFHYYEYYQYLDFNLKNNLIN
jgi:3-deoxy-D-manno-octulosonate 8-phosphate phosphatase KdsC-like HAD superfamily phosphatase